MTVTLLCLEDVMQLQNCGMFGPVGVFKHFRVMSLISTLSPFSPTTTLSELDLMTPPVDSLISELIKSFLFTGIIIFSNLQILKISRNSRIRILGRGFLSQEPQKLKNPQYLVQKPKFEKIFDNRDENLRNWKIPIIRDNNSQIQKMLNTRYKNPGIKKSQISGIKNPGLKKSRN